MATAEQIKSLLSSYSDRDDSRFYSTAMQVAASEARKGNRTLAAEIRKMIDQARAREAAGEPVPISSPPGDMEDLLSMTKPQVRLSDMVLTAELHSRLQRILNEQKQIEKIRSHGLDPRRKLLLSGPPGCGKTMSAAVLAGELGLPLFTVRLDSLITKFLGETATKLRLIFETVAKHRAVYFFDEFDAIGSQRGMVHEVGEMRRIVNSFLMLIENCTGSSLVVAATNDASALDSALFRRFDALLELPVPEESRIIEICRNRLASVPTSRLAFKKVAQAAAGMSYAEICRVCDEAIKEMLLDDKKTMTTQRLLKALDERRTFITERTR